MAPVLAVEVAGVDDTLAILREKARWYLEQGVEVVWLLVPRSRTVLVLTADTEVELSSEQAIPPNAALPDLAPDVADLFRQLDA